MTALSLSKKGLNRLVSCGIENAKNENDILCAEFLGVSKTDLLIDPEKTVNEESENKYLDGVERRCSGEPLQYIIGKWDFLGHSFSVGRGVLIPRPETELLTVEAIKTIKSMKSPVVYDLCAGSGCIGLSVKLNCPEARVFSVEKSDDALFYLNINRDSLSLSKDVSVIKGDILRGFEAFSALPKPDVIISNPPYIPSDEISDLQKEVLSEPEMALDGGIDGLLFYKAIAESWVRNVNKGGYVFLEVGENQARAVADIFSGIVSECKIIKDYAGVDRIVYFRV